MACFNKVGIGAGQAFDADNLNPEMRDAIQDGMADAWKALAEGKKLAAEGKVTAGDVLGSREHLKNNYLYRMLGAVLAMYGNAAQEAMYPAYMVDASGQALDAAQNRYTLCFAPGQLPPVNAFWSLTMYELPASLLVANPRNRYLINSPMLPDLKRDADGGLTLYSQAGNPHVDHVADRIEYNEFCRRGQMQQKSGDACAGMPGPRYGAKVTGRLIRLPASLQGEIEKLIMVAGDRRDDWRATPS
jgi:hypothetical protein